MKNIYDMLQSLQQSGHYVVDTVESLVLTREQLGETISSDYSKAVEVLESNLLGDTLKVCDPEIYEKLKTYEGKFTCSEEILFYLQYNLNPSLPFSYKDVIYRDISTLGRDIVNKPKNNFKDTIIEALKLKLFSFYAKAKKLEEIRADIVSCVEQAEALVLENPELAYYLLGLYLGDIRSYTYNNKTFYSVLNLYNYLGDKNLLVSFSKTELENVKFVAWVYALGFGKEYEKWVSEVQRIDEMYA